MPSPFLGFDNATLIFQIPTGTYAINSTGGRTPVTAPVSIRALLKPVRDVAQIQYYLGADQTSELMRGYLVEPMSLPAGLHLPADGVAEIEIAIGVVAKGSFKMLPCTASPYLVGAGIDLVNRIQGVFKRN